MRKRLNLFFTIFIVFLLSKAASGANRFENIEINENTTWSGEIIITGTATVERNAILTISPGTTIKFISPDGALIIKGSLLADGAYDQKIILTSDENTKWKGVILTAEKTEATISKISNCIIKYANTGVECSEMVMMKIENCIFTKNDLAVSFFMQANGIISHNEFIENAVGGIICEQAKLRINNNSFINNTNFAVSCVKGSFVDIEGNMITRSKYGIMFSNISTSGQIKNNIIQENEYGIFTSYIGKPEISNNTIQNNDYGIYIKQDAVPKIFLNEIAKNRVGIFIMESYNLNILSINDNNIYDNKEYEAGLEKSSAEYARGIIKDMAGDTTDNYPPFLKNYIMGGLTPLDYIDAKRNFWGKELTEEMKVKGPSANISKIMDFYDNPKEKMNYYMYNEWRAVPVEGAGAKEGSSNETQNDSSFMTDPADSSSQVPLPKRNQFYGIKKKTKE